MLIRGNSVTLWPWAWPDPDSKKGAEAPDFPRFYKIWFRI